MLGCSTVSGEVLSSPTTVPDDDEPDRPFESAKISCAAFDGLVDAPFTTGVWWSASLSEPELELESVS